MPRVLVKLYTTLKLRLGQSQVWIEGDTAGDLLKGLAKLGGPKVAELLFDETGAVNNHFVLALDSDILDRNALDQAALKEGNVLHIFPPISGG